MARDRNGDAAAAAAAASEAGRVLREQRDDVSRETNDRHSDNNEVRLVLNDDHRRSMEGIRQSREAAEKGEQPQELPPEPTPPSADDMLQGSQFSETQQPEQIQEAAPQPAAEQPPKVKVKVDGEEFEVNQSDVDEYGGVKGYQIAKAAENRLKKASEAVAETRKMQEMLLMHARQQMAPQQPQLTDEQFVASKLDVIRFGNQDEAAAALLEVLNRNKSNAPDPISITNQAVAEIKYQNAVEKFKADFPEITANKQLEDWATVMAQREITAMQQNRMNFVSVDWNEFFGRIGNQIRNVVGKPNQQPAAPVSQTASNTSLPSEKEARKASIVNLPTASARAELPREQKPETREQALNRMRASRGQKTG